MEELAVTVCELRNTSLELEEDWQALVAHVRREGSQLVLLPEMPFSPWFPVSDEFDPLTWREAILAHTAWLKRLSELAPAAVLVTRPVELGLSRHNQAVVCEPGKAPAPAHLKYYLPQDLGFWESAWYQRGDGDFSTVPVGDLSAGFLICTELWFMQRAREYGQQGAHLVAVPRATGVSTVDKWLAAGRVAAVVSGAYCLSSNRSAGIQPGLDLGGQGWIIDPDGEVLGLTSAKEPFITRRIDPRCAELAKTTYPRYVAD